jgi:antitoxin MazE
MRMTTKIQKIGNSLAVYIPKALALKKGFREGLSVEFSDTPKGLVLEHKEKPKEYYFDIKELCKNLTPYEERDVIDWGAPQGREIW